MRHKVVVMVEFVVMDKEPQDDPFHTSRKIEQHLWDTLRDPVLELRVVDVQDYYASPEDENEDA